MHKSLSLMPGLIIQSGLFILFILLLGTLLLASPVTDPLAIFKHPYLWRIINFTMLQAFLSTVLSVLPAFLIAYALYRREFKLKHILLKICSSTLVLPSLVIVFGMITLYGRNGIITNLIVTLFGESYRFNIYGLKGILLAHVFFNLPFATLIFLKALQSIPAVQNKLAAQLNFTSWYRFKILHWPILKKQIATSSVLIFTLCFMSFSIALTLGGGPKSTTIEVAIYQAVTYEFDYFKAAILSLVQIFLCALLLGLSQTIKTLTFSFNSGEVWDITNKNRWVVFFDVFLILILIILIIPPLSMVIFSGINSDLLVALQDTKVWAAAINSFMIGLIAAVLSTFLATCLIWSARQLHINNHKTLANLMISSGSMTLIIPSLSLTTAIFIILNHLSLNSTVWTSPYTLIPLVNCLMALPFSINLLLPNLLNSAKQYNLLCDQLNIKGWQRWFHIDFKSNISAYKKAFAFTFTLSLGDIGVMSLIGSQQTEGEFLTLPYLLFLQLGTYQSAIADVTALILLILVLAIFFMIDTRDAKH